MTTRGKSPEVLAYAAGFIDGEGSIGISKAMPRPGWKTRNTTPVYEVTLTVVNTVEAPMAWLHAEFGGSLRLKKPAANRWRPQWCWVLGNRQAADFCRMVLPYFKVKHRQAQLCIDFMERKALTPKRYKMEVPAEELAAREAMRIEMFLLNDSRGARGRPQRLSEGVPV